MAPTSPRVLPDLFETDTTTQVIVPRRTAHRPKSPPAPRASRESELPRVMLAPDPWSTRTERMPRARLAGAPLPDFEDRMAATRVLTKPVAATARPAPPEGGSALLVAGLAFTLGALTLYMFPVFARLVDGALAFVR